MPAQPSPESNGAEIAVDFIRHRNVLLVQGDCGPLLVDYYLHQADHKLRHEPANDTLLRQALVAFTLHCASRPRHEHLAWTVGLQEPRLNLFLAGDNEDCTVTGRLFTENVREAPRNMFFSEVMPRRGAEKARSVVDFSGADPFRAAEAFYRASEQRTARYFDLGEDRHALLLSHPDCDEAWLARISLEDVARLGSNETLARIERRLYRWHCGCNQRKILAALAPAAANGLGDLFGDAELIHVQCPRCAASHAITRESMEAWLAANGRKT